MQSPSIDGSLLDHYIKLYKGYAENSGARFHSGIVNYFLYLLIVGSKYWNTVFHTSNLVTGVGIEITHNYLYVP